MGASSSVLVVGAGGLGSFVGSALARAGRPVTLLARGDHAEAVRARGLRIREPDGVHRVPVAVVEPGDLEAAGRVPYGFVIVAVKAHSLEEVAPLLVRLAREGAVLLPLLNGVDAAERLVAEGAPPEQVVDGVAYVTAFRTGPGEIERKGRHGRVVVGSSTGRSTDKVPAVVNLFDGTSIEVAAAADIREELWLKMAVVSSLAALCGMSGAPLGPLRRHPLGPAVQARMIHEVLSVGRGQGVDLPADAEETVGATLDGFADDFYPSVLHDLRNGGPTEMDALCGTLTRLGRRAGIATPALDAATLAVAAREGRESERSRGARSLGEGSPRDEG